MTTTDGRVCWTMSSDQYCKAAIDNVEKKLEKTNKRLPTKCGDPLTSGYKPELDASAELKADGLQTYQELIGVLRWAVEIGRIDIFLETSLMSVHLDITRIGHLEQVIHIFGYLKQNSKKKIAFDPEHPHIDERRFQKYDWYGLYPDTKEAIPGDLPKPIGYSMSTH